VVCGRAVARGIEVRGSSAVDMRTTVSHNCLFINPCANCFGQEIGLDSSRVNSSIW
jgi:hypothetical protein